MAGKDTNNQDYTSLEEFVPDTTETESPHPQEEKNK